MEEHEKPMHLLFVDDDSDESYLFNEAIEHAGLNVSLSKSKDGNDLLRFLELNPTPDIIFIDLNMPYKDGLEALSEIRINHEFNKLPLVIYSTTSNALYIDECYAKGANMFVVKPETFDGIVEVVKTILQIDWTKYQRPSREDFVFNVNK